jgi:hypothetical protein
MDDNNGLKKINKMYQHLTYFDQYGGSFLLFIFITLVLAIFISYCYIKINSQPVIADWTNQRCKPYIIPFAGFITHPEGVSASDYTYQNFTYCTQNILASITGIMLEPITFVTNSLSSGFDDLENSINDVRAMFDKVRSFFQNMTQELMGRIMNVMIPLQQIIISFKDLIAKIQGTMTAGLYTLIGSYFTLQSLMGAIAQFILIILITLSAMIAAFWILPFTWPVAIVNTVIFIAIAIPMAIILTFMVDVLKVKTSLSIPSVKCFDENTMIYMNDGTNKKICDIIVGDMLFGNNMVTGVIKVATEGSKMYSLDGIIVSDSHIVKHNNNWIKVCDHPDAIRYAFYDKPYLYCLNTANKTITIGLNTFTDWDEVYNEEIIQLKNNSIKPFIDTKDIHTFLDSGFVGSTEIKLKNDIIKPIKDIKVGDILENNEIVYGVVEINGDTVYEQYVYNLNDKTVIEGGPNITICDKKIPYITTLDLDKRQKTIRNCREKKLYHLLTNTSTFSIHKIRFYDYNAGIDLFLDKYRGKILSIKYI